MAPRLLHLRQPTDLLWRRGGMSLTSYRLFILASLLLPDCCGSAAGIVVLFLASTARQAPGSPETGYDAMSSLRCKLQRSILFVALAMPWAKVPAQRRPNTQTSGRTIHTSVDLQSMLEASAKHIVSRKPFQSRSRRLLFLLHLEKTDLTAYERQSFLRRFAPEPRVDYEVHARPERRTGKIDRATGRYVIGLYIEHPVWNSKGRAAVSYTWIEGPGAGGRYTLSLQRGTKGWKAVADRQTGRF